MKTARFPKEQIFGIPKQVEGRRKIADVCRQHGIRDPTDHRWKGKYGGLEVTQLRRLRRVEDENRRLKQLVGKLMLDNAALKERYRKERVTPAARRVAVAYLQEHHTCRNGGRVCWPEPRRRQAGISRADCCRSRCARLRELAQARPHFLYPCPALPVRREQGAVNHERVYRVYRLDGLAVRRSGGHRLRAGVSG